MISHSYDTRYSGKDITIEYEVEPGEDNFNYPGHICDGGGGGPIIIIIEVYSDQGRMLYNQRQSEKWDMEIGESIASDPHFFDVDDYDDNYM